MSYSPTIGRFIQRDPEEYIDGMNPYQAYRGNPAGLVDPLGLQGQRPTTRPDRPFWIDQRDIDLIVVAYDSEDSDPDATRYTNALRTYAQANGVQFLPHPASVGAIVDAVKAIAKQKGADENSKKQVGVHMLVAGHGNAEHGPLLTTGGQETSIIGGWGNIRGRIPVGGAEPVQLPRSEFRELKGLVREVTFTGCAVAADKTNQALLDIMAADLGARLRAFQQVTEQGALKDRIIITPTKPEGLNYGTFVYETGAAPVMKEDRR